MKFMNLFNMINRDQISQIMSARTKQQCDMGCHIPWWWDQCGLVVVQSLPFQMSVPSSQQLTQHSPVTFLLSRAQDLFYCLICLTANKKINIKPNTCVTHSYL